MKSPALLAAIAGLLIAADATQPKQEKIFGYWSVTSVKAATGKATWLSHVEEVSFTKAGQVRGAAVPERAAVVLTDGRVLVLDCRQGPAKRAGEIDLILVPAIEPNAEVFRGIFVVEGKTCKLCLSPSGADRPTGLTPKKGSGQVLLVLRRDD
jgi:hypothetical protein